MIIRRKQKEFNIIQEFIHSGKDRVIKKYAGRIQRSISNNYRKLSRNQLMENKKLNKELEEVINNDGIDNKKLGLGLAKDMNKLGNGRVFDKNKFSDTIDVERSNYNLSTNSFKDKNEVYDYLIDDYSDAPTNIKRTAKKVANSIISKDNIVNLDGDYKNRISVMAHEIGHAVNSTGNAGKEKQIVSRLDSINRYKKLPDKGTKQRIQDQRKVREALEKEEFNAWDTGINLMKNNKASKEEISKTMKVRDIALGTYKTGTRVRDFENKSKYLEPNGIYKDKISIYPKNHSKEKEDIVNKVVSLLPENERDLYKSQIKADVDKLHKTERQLVQEKRKRYNNRKDKSILGQIFGNSRKRK